MSPREQKAVPIWRAVDPIRILLFLSIAFFIVPPPPPPVGLGLDPSWILGLNAAHARGLKFGQDVAFTYGPWGFLLSPIPPFSNKFIALIGGLAPFVLFTISLWLLINSKKRASWLYGAIALAAWFPLEPYPAQRFEVACIVWLLAILAAPEQIGISRLAITGLLAAAALNIKASTGVLLLACYVCLVVTEFLSRRLSRNSLLPLMAGPALIFLAPYIKAPGAILGYLITCWQMTVGYSEAMALPGPLWQVIFGLITIALIALYYLTDRLRRRLPFILGLLVLIFAFKNSMVRQDHAAPFHLYAGMAIAIASTGIRTASARWAALEAAALSAAAGLVSVAMLDPGLATEMQSRVAVTVQDRYAKAWLNWPAYWQYLTMTERRSLSTIRMGQDFQSIVGKMTVEAVPYAVDHIVANGWNWDPRPVFQTYAAYTPYLDHLNAMHVRGRGAAEFILLNWGAIDERHPFLEDPLSWVETIDRYRVRLTHSDYSLLERRPVSLLEDARPLGGSIVTWGQDVTLPATDGFLIMRAHIKYSMIGTLRKALLRATPVYMTVTKASGRRIRWRALQSNLQDGAIVNYMPESVEELALLTGERGILPEAVRSIRFETEHPSDYDGKIEISWETRSFNDAPTPGLESKEALWLPGEGLPSGLDTRLERTPAGIHVNTWTNDPQLHFACRADLGRFSRIVIRARFAKRDYIDLFFGQQVNGRGMDAMVPVAGKWIDVIFNVDMNPFWRSEAGTDIRFDPSSGVGVNSVDIAGIWGETGSNPPGASPVEFRFAPPHSAKGQQK